MCDRCGTIFSERDEGWSTFSGSTRKRDNEGKWVTQTDSLDSCPECTELMTGASVRPVAALGSSVKPVYQTSGD